MASNKDLMFLIGKILELDEFWRVNYYIRTMKKAPHGGVMHITSPNVYLMHYPFAPWSFVSHSEDKIPFFMQALIDESIKIYKECSDIDDEELLQYCFGGENNWYTGFQLLQIKPKYKAQYSAESITFLWRILENHQRISDYFIIPPHLAVYGLVLALVEERALTISDISIIEEHEQLRNPYNKYGLTLINNAEFLRQGFVIDDTYYLYNIFLDTTIGDPCAKMPLTLQIINHDIPHGKLFMRCDNCLSVPRPNIFSTDTVDFQKFHGITLNFANIERLLGKQIIVHIHSELLHKILVVVKPDVEDGNIFYHIEIEELWNPATLKDDRIMTVFLHAKYFPKITGFTHIDYSINQYESDTYSAKYSEAKNESGIPVDKYCDLHYKIWCVEAGHISIETWSHLICATLDEPFREIFLETFQ